jgi:hypothetical protein
MSVALSEIKQELSNGRGFTLDLKLAEAEIHILRSLIKEHALQNIQKIDPLSYKDYDSLPLYEFHTLETEALHKKIWEKKNRIFPTFFTEEIKKLPFFQILVAEFGPILIANEENIYPEEIYWRYVRPKQANDVGPLHADKWFWDLGHGFMPEGYYRLKIWIPIYCAPGGNGLRVVPYSHKYKYDYHAEMRDGFLKPVFDETKYQLNIIKLDSNPGEAVIFHDELLHGGCFNNAETSRFSIEFTMLIKQ